VNGLEIVGAEDFPPLRGFELGQKIAIFDNCEFGPDESQDGNEKPRLFAAAV